MKKIFKIAIVALAIVATGAATANAAFNANLSVGATGADVSALQSWLISKGFAIPSISSGAAMPGYFGQQTKSAVVAYQASVGLPATGFVGPLTRGILNGSPVVSGPVACPVGYNCTPTNPSNPSTPVSTGSLAGTDGNIQQVDLLSQYSDEEVGEGETDVKVFGFEVEASNDGDIALKSIKVEIVPDGSNSDHLDDYIEGITIWQGSTKIGSADVDDFSQASNDNWTKTVTVSNSVVRADETEKFYISVDAVNSFDSSDIDNDAHTIDITSIRFEDGSGVVSTEDVTITAQQMDFVSFSESADTEVKFSTDSSSPEAGIVVVDDNDDTDDVTVLVGKIKVEGTSDITLDEVPVTLTVTGATDVDAVTNSITLKIDGEEYTETVTTASVATASVVFNNLDLTLEAGKSYTFTVTADINNIDGVGFSEGNTLVASLTSTNRDYVDAEDEEGDQVSDSDKTGTVTGDAQEFRTNGIALTLVSTDTDATTGTSANDDVGLFTIKYKVTAIGDTVYLSSLATTAGLTFAVDKGGVATTSVTIVGALVNNTDTTMTSVGNYEIEDGESETFTLSVSVPISAASGSGQYRTALTGVKWDTSDDTSMANTYSSELDSFKTDYKVLN